MSRFGAWTRDDFHADPLLSPRPRQGRLSWFFILFGLSFLSCAVAWASIAEVEQVTRGEGRIVPSSRIQLVQSLEGGILSELHVREGDRVSEGELLLNIDDTQFAASLEEVDAKRAALSGKIARLEAEVAERRTLDFPGDFADTHPDIAASERRLFGARRTALESELRTLRARRDQREEELAENRATQARLRDQISLLQEEISLNERVSDLVPEAEMLRLRKDLGNLEGELRVARSSEARATSAIGEANSLISQARADYRSEAQNQLTDAEAEFSIASASSKSAGDRVVRAGLRSPVDGVVNAVHVATVGGVVAPGEPLVEIVPYDDALQIEARIRPQDIAFITPDQPARVTITAYDYSIYGGLVGRVERIGADSLTDEVTGETYFPIDIVADAANFSKDDEPLPLSPGMVASVDIITGENTVLNYLLKPVNKARYEALRER